MCDFDPFVNQNAIQKVPLKDLQPELYNILVVGIIIAKQRVRKFPDKKEPEMFNAVWNFTLRDSPRDYINVTFWGKSEVVSAANERFFTGDVGKVFPFFLNEKLLMWIL